MAIQGFEFLDPTLALQDTQLNQIANGGIAKFNGDVNVNGTNVSVKDGTGRLNGQAYVVTPGGNVMDTGGQNIGQVTNGQFIEGMDINALIGGGDTAKVTTPVKDVATMGLVKDNGLISEAQGLISSLGSAQGKIRGAISNPVNALDTAVENLAGTSLGDLSVNSLLDRAEGGSKPGEVVESTKKAVKQELLKSALKAMFGA